ncbi:MAG: hypothetical protein CL908_26480 [Deltaproteobacteria bacterium]|jgi:putative hydrolase of the HAD superfamily|nr:hypothetical protein [Deltaproteobacteria bacterium]
MGSTPDRAPSAAPGLRPRDHPSGQAICLDATGTLIETSESVGEVYHRVALAHGVDLPAWRLDDAFRRVILRAPPRGLAGNSRLERRQHEMDWWSERVRQTFQATDSTARFDDFAAFASALFDTYRDPTAWRIRDGVARTLATLRRREFRLALVSNFDHRLLEILEAFDLFHLFCLIEIPSEHGWAKPDPALFESVAERLEQPIEALWYVGDDAPETLAAIARLGVRVVDLRRLGRLDALLEVPELR